MSTTEPRTIIENALRTNLMIGCAESCTGGLLSAALTSSPGSSSVFKGCVVSYANRVKSEVLEVPEEVLDFYGAVSSETAAAMAQGARRVLGADVTISTTGIAGPDGGTPDKPVGTVWFGIDSSRGTRTILKSFGQIGRDQIRTEAVEFALVVLEEEIEELQKAF